MKKYLSVEIYVSGSLNVFNHRTNINISNRVVSFDIKELGKQLKKIGMLIVQDQVWNRVTENRAEKKSTRYYIDEMHLLLREEQTAAYSIEIWKRFRKWGGIPTGITQNVKDLLSSREIENIFENSDYILMLNQAGGDREILAKQLNISPHQLSYVTHSGEGEGLLFYGNVILPFIDRFPKDTELYKVMTTKLTEPGQVSAEEANQIGYEFAMRFTKGRHAFIVATHTDKAHIHNHIIWNSTTLDCTHKFRDFKRSGKAVMELSDLICVEHGLPIIEIPKNKRVSYDKWLGANHVETKRDRLCAAIEEALRSHPKSIEELLELLQEAGYETKVGKDIAARYKGDKRFLRFSTLGEGYGKDELLAVLLGEKQLKPKRKQYTRSQKVSLLIDIQEKLDAGKGVGYQRWASVFNAKELAKTINFLQAHGFSSYDELCQIADSAVDHFNELSDSIRDAETRMADITVLKEQIINYAKTREV